MSTGIVSNELEHHMFPVVRYTQIGGSADGTTAVAGSAFTFGEGTLVTCWHCVKQPLGPDEFYGIAVRRGSVESPYEFCSIDNLERDHNGADLALGHIDWMPGRGLTLGNDPVKWGERVETYGYPFPLAVPDQVYPDYKALHFYSRFLRGYVTRLARDEAERPVMPARAERRSGDSRGSPRRDRCHLRGTDHHDVRTNRDLRAGAPPGRFALGMRCRDRRAATG